MRPVAIDNKLGRFVRNDTVSHVKVNLFSPAGKLRYANNSNYKNDVMIRKEVTYD